MATSVVVDAVRRSARAAPQGARTRYRIGLGLLLASNGAMHERMQGMARSGVTFAACENTMKRMKVTKEQLMPFATTVDSGVAEVVRKQEAGWSYIRSGS